MHEINLPDPGPQGLNARRSWCRMNLGPEHVLWQHVWLPRGGYCWRFSTREAEFLFRLAWT